MMSGRLSRRDFIRGAGVVSVGLAMGSDLRYGTARSKVAFLFVRVGLAGQQLRGADGVDGAARHEVVDEQAAPQRLQLFVHNLSSYHDDLAGCLWSSRRDPAEIALVRMNCR